MSDVTIRRVAALGMITLRGDLGVLGAATARVVGLDAPEMRMSVAEGHARLLWMSPDELLLTGPAAGIADWAKALTDVLGDDFATVAIVSDARAVFDLDGPQVPDLLAKLCPVDFDALAAAEVRRTRLAQVAAAFWREGSGWRLVCFRSVADYVEAALRNAADAPMPGLYAPSRG